jgi:hypothetical protein
MIHLRAQWGRASGRTGRILAVLLALAGSDSPVCSGAVAPGASREAPRVVHSYDARPLRGINLKDAAQTARVWDTMHLLAALQGLVNRESPRLYVFYCYEFGADTDAFWFDWLRGEDGWLKDAAVRRLATLDEALQVFRADFEGLVVYDPKVPATANLASTAAGCERLLPVRFDPEPGQLFRRLTRELGLPVKLWLVNPDGSPKFTGRGWLPDSTEPSSGSAKVDAYRWAMKRYLRSGRCAPGFAAYYIDAFWLQRPAQGPPDLHTLSNHDYFVAHRAFFFDLSPWGDETPVDDPDQVSGLDRRTLLEVLRALHDRAGGGMVKVGGFTPWPFKYTTHGNAGKHEGVPTEWEFTRLVSQYNGYLEADAAGPGAMANASFFQHYPLAQRYAHPNPKPTLAEWRSRGFVTAEGRVANRLFVGHYVGDYDSPSWLYKAVPAFFRDPARGRVPLSWAFNPNLADRAPQALAYAYRHATTNDFFITGDSGAGYLNVRGLTVRPESRLPPGLDAWQAHCRRHYERWDMTITGFVLDGAAGAATEREFAAYRGFSPDGLGTHFEAAPALRAGVPTCPEKDLPDSVEEAAALIARQARAAAGKPGFLWARSILKPPQWYADLSGRLREQHPGLEVDIVDPYSFFGLVRLHVTESSP